MNTPRRVVLHCSATKDGRESTVTRDEIDRWHRARGWKNGIGYHEYLTREGFIHRGRKHSVQGAHCKGNGMNRDSLGVCYEGTYFPTVWQLDSIFDLYRQWRDLYKIEWPDWYVHNQFSSKECPGFDVDILHSLLRKLA